MPSQFNLQIQDQPEVSNVVLDELKNSDGSELSVKDFLALRFRAPGSVNRISVYSQPGTVFSPEIQSTEAGNNIHDVRVKLVPSEKGVYKIDKISFEVSFSPEGQKASKFAGSFQVAADDESVLKKPHR
jgi:hypothetical protein